MFTPISGSLTDRSAWRIVSWSAIAGPSTQIKRVVLSGTGLGGGLGRGSFQAADDRVEARHALHSEYFQEARAAHQVVGRLRDLRGAGPLEALDQERDEPADRGRLDGDVRVQFHATLVDLDEQVDGGLALLDPMGGVLVGLKALGQPGERPGQVDQELDPLLTVDLGKFPDQVRQLLGHALAPSGDRARLGSLDDRRPDHVPPLEPRPVVISYAG